MARQKLGTDPANKDITHALCARTGFASIAEMSANIMFATKKQRNPFAKHKPFRPGIPAKFKDFDNREINGEIVECVVLEYMDGLDGETVERAHPCNTMFTELEFIATSKCSATYIKTAKLEGGL